MSDTTYEFYMQECDSSWNPISSKPARNLEKDDDFVGLKYSKATGIDALGKPRIYVEKFPTEEKESIYIPEDVTYESTTITFTFFFLGENRRQSLKKFLDFCSYKRIKYWDTARLQAVYVYVNNSITNTEEQWHGSTPYLSLTMQATNVYGKAFGVDKNGNHITN